MDEELRNDSAEQLPEEPIEDTVDSDTPKPQPDVVEQPREVVEENSTEKTSFGLIRARSINNEMSESYLDYAMSVIVSRALPDVRDGLKPVHRRILYAMHDMGLTPGAKHRKSAKINGEVLGNYHPHGELAVYDAMVRMAQWWSLRLPLVNGQGNFGSMDGDSPAASRYTEARLAPPAEALLADIEKETVDYRDNYDGTRQEPVVLPTRLPNLLINGSQGIAVGMATNIPPHNPAEVIDGLLVLQKNPNASLEELMEAVKGPDFPTGGIIYNQNDIKEAFATGRGRILIRGRAEIVEDKKREQIVVTELPYQTNKATFIVHIAELVKAKKIEGIHDIRDESDRKEGVRVVIELKTGAVSSKILNQLYELTELQTVIHYNMVALVDGIQPKVLTLTEALTEFLGHRTDVVTRRTNYELKIAKARAHILEGLKIALDHLDAIIKLIRESANRDAAKAALMNSYKLSEIQANAILDMRLSQLANLERQKIYDEYDAVMKLIADLEDILAKPERVEAIIREELLEMKKKYGDARRTEIRPEALNAMTALDLIPEENVLITLTANNYVKRLTPDTYRSQSRGGKGVIGMTTREDDVVMDMIFASTHDDILFFTDKGRAFKVKTYEIPAASRQSKGVALPNIIRILPDEKVTEILSVKASDQFEYFFFATREGTVKRVERKAFDNVRKSGVTAVGLKGKDQLIWVKRTSGNDEIAQITKNAQVIVYNESEVRAMGRSASGVRGIKLKSGDIVIETTVLNDASQSICVISERGIGKRVLLKEFRNQHRGGSGIRIAKITEKTGKLAAGAVIEEGVNDLIISSVGGQVIRIPVNDVKHLSRQASGVILMRTNAGDTVSTLAVVNQEQETEKEPS
jgi:DNA gyrase subunit A